MSRTRIPVIALDHHSAHDWMPDNAGIKVPVTVLEETISALAATIEKLYREPELREKDGRERVCVCEETDAGEAGAGDGEAAHAANIVWNALALCRFGLHPSAANLTELRERSQPLCVQHDWRSRNAIWGAAHRRIHGCPHDTLFWRPGLGMRILCVGRTPFGGGAERAQVDLLVEFTRLGAEFEVQFLQNRTELPGIVRALLPMTILLEEHQKVKPNVLRILWRIYRSALRADIVFGMQDGTPIYLAAIAGLMARKPIVGWIHGSPTLDSNVYFGWHKVAMPVLYRLAKKLVCDSVVTRESVRSVMGDLGDRLTVVYEPIDVDNIRRQSQEALPDSAAVAFGYKVVLGVGRFVPKKRLNLLIEVAAQLKKKRGDFHVVILGSGPEKARYVELCSNLGVRDMVTIIDFDPNPYRYMKRAKMVVIPSAVEPFGIVTCEALALGKPVICTSKYLAFQEIVGEEKDLGVVADDTIESLAASIDKELSSGEDALLCERRMRRAECFDVRRSATAILEIISDAFGKGTAQKHTRRKQMNAL